LHQSSQPAVFGLQALNDRGHASPEAYDALFSCASWTSAIQLNLSYVTT
jgi:hypothetical protein